MNKEIVSKLSTPEGVDDHVDKLINTSTELIALFTEISASANYYVRNYNTLVKALKLKLGEKEANIIIEAAKLSSFEEYKKEAKENG